MSTTTISLEVDPESARVFSESPPEERRKLELLLKLRLRELTSASPRRLSEVMDEIGEYAVAQGLTEETLESLMHDD